MRPMGLYSNLSKHIFLSLEFIVLTVSGAKNLIILVKISPKIIAQFQFLMSRKYKNNFKRNLCFHFYEPLSNRTPNPGAMDFINSGGEISVHHDSLSMSKENL